MSPEVLTASIAAVVAVTVAVVPLWARARGQRTEAYAQAAQALVAWHEFPYRIARRTSDSTDELARLAASGHDLQETLARHQAWLHADSQRLGNLYDELLADLRAWVGVAAAEAWRRTPVRLAQDMNLGRITDSSPDIVGMVTRFARSTRFRFGWRRLLWWKIGD